MLREGELWGFKLVDGKWLAPDCGGAAQAEARKQTQQRRRADDQAAALARSTAEAWYRDWKQRWDDLPASERERIYAQASSDSPLFARFPRDSYSLLSVCLRVLESENQALG